MRENIDLLCQLYLILLYIFNIELTRRAPGNGSGTSPHLELLQLQARSKLHLDAVAIAPI